MNIEACGRREECPASITWAVLGDAISRRWLSRCSAARPRHVVSTISTSRRWSPTNCAGRPTFLDMPSANPRSAAILRAPCRDRETAPAISAAQAAILPTRPARSGSGCATAIRRLIALRRPPQHRLGCRYPKRPDASLTRLLLSEKWREREPEWFTRRCVIRPAHAALIVGLAPGLRGANRTGRPFTRGLRRRSALRTLKHRFFPGTFAARPSTGSKLSSAHYQRRALRPRKNKPTDHRDPPCTATTSRRPSRRCEAKAIVAPAGSLRTVGRRGGNVRPRRQAWRRAKLGKTRCSAAITARATTRTPMSHRKCFRRCCSGAQDPVSSWRQGS